MSPFLLVNEPSTAMKIRCRSELSRDDFEEILRFLDFLDFWAIFAPMEVISVPEKCLTGTSHNFGGSSTIEGNLYGEALGHDALIFGSHEESCMFGGFG
jgi:hypothetical protein